MTRATRLYACAGAVHSASARSAAMTKITPPRFVSILGAQVSRRGASRGAATVRAIAKIFMRLLALMNTVPTVHQRKANRPTSQGEGCLGTGATYLTRPEKT